MRLAREIVGVFAASAVRLDGEAIDLVDLVQNARRIGKRFFSGPLASQGDANQSTRVTLQNPGRTLVA